MTREAYTVGRIVQKMGAQGIIRLDWKCLGFPFFFLYFFDKEASEKYLGLIMIT